MINGEAECGEAECSVLIHSVLVPPSKALAIVLAIGVTLSSFMMLGVRSTI
jgi:hypothetical protein